MNACLIFIFIILAGVGVAKCQTPSDNANSAAQTAVSAPEANPVAPPSEAPKLTAAELEKLAMPIALYPDPLIAVMLPASVYPVEVVQAARFVRDTNNIPAIDDQPWDENVKAVAKFPDAIAKMDSDLNWTINLGQAFLNQPKELMDAIQALRAKAQKAGTLQTTPQQIITVTNEVVLVTNSTQVVTETKEVVYIQPANPQVVYVPTYTSAVYYPPPAYVYNPYAPLVTFGVGMAWGAILANNCDWYGGSVWHGGGDVNVNNNININENINRGGNVNNGGNINGGNGGNGNNGGNRPGNGGNGGNGGNRPGNGSNRPGDGGNRPGNGGNRPSQLPAQKWQPDQNRLRNNAGGSVSSREARGWGSAGNRPSTGNIASRPSTGNVGARPSTGAVGTRPSTGNVGNRPSTGAGGSRPSTGNAASRPSTGNTGGRASTGTTARNRSGSSGGAFSGAGNSGASARRDSSRGSTSRSGGFSGGSRGGGGGGARGGGGRGGGRR